MKKFVTFLLVFVLFFSNLYTVAFGADIHLDYNVVRGRFGFDYGEITLEFPAHPSDSSTSSSQVQYRWAPGFTAELHMRNDTPAVYGRMCDSCTCPPLPGSLPGSISGCNCSHPFSPGCPERGLLHTSNGRFTETSPGGHIYVWNIPFGDHSDSETVNIRFYARICRISIWGQPPNWYTLPHSYPQATGTISVVNTGIINRSFQRRTRTRHWIPGTDYSPGQWSSWSAWSGWSHAGYRQASFDGHLVDSRTVTARVYNGMDELPNPPEFLREIIYNTARPSTSPERTLLWESTPLPFYVRRLFYSQNTSGSISLISHTLGNRGRRTREFVEQNEAEVTFSIVPQMSMLHLYANDRLDARNQVRSPNIERVVFASDFSFRNEDFPVRAGHFFNPAGTYTFTVSTSLYTRTPYATTEHRVLVDALISAFRYESTLTYINPNQHDPNGNFRMAVGIDNQRVDLDGTTFPPARRMVRLWSPTPSTDATPTENWRSASADPSVHPAAPTLVPISVEIETEDAVYERLLRGAFTSGDISAGLPQITQAIDTAYNNQSILDSVTDPRFQRVMEGYAASGTDNSRTQFRYTEYAAEDIFRVTEVTHVTITVNPNNRRLFTHAMMRGGNHHIRAFFADINLPSLYLGEEFQLNGLQYVAPSLTGFVFEDIIRIRVVGSIFDDLR